MELKFQHGKSVYWCWGNGRVWRVGKTWLRCECSPDRAGDSCEIPLCQAQPEAAKNWICDTHLLKKKGHAQNRPAQTPGARRDELASTCLLGGQLDHAERRVHTQLPRRLPAKSPQLHLQPGWRSLAGGKESTRHLFVLVVAFPISSDKGTQHLMLSLFVPREYSILVPHFLQTLRLYDYPVAFWSFRWFQALQAQRMVRICSLWASPATPSGSTKLRWTSLATLQMHTRKPPPPHHRKLGFTEYTEDFSWTCFASLSGWFDGTGKPKGFDLKQ